MAQNAAGAGFLQRVGGGGVALNGGGYNPQLTFGGVPRAGTLYVNGGSQSPAAAAPAPATPSPSPYTGGGNAGSQADIAAYSDNISSLDRLLRSADSSRTTGESAINTSYNNQNARLNQSQSRTLSGYATQRGDTQTDYQKNLQTINNQARTGYNSLQRLLGGTGSAGDVLAASAVSTQANRQRNDSSQKYARNLRDLDTAETDARAQYSNALEDLLSQKNSKLQSLIAAVNSNKQNLLSQRAAAENQLRIAQGGSYAAPRAALAQIDALQGETDNLARTYADPQFMVRDVNAMAPDLARYNAEAAALADGGTGQVEDDGTGNSFAALLRMNRERLGYAY